MTLFLAVLLAKGVAVRSDGNLYLISLILSFENHTHLIHFTFLSLFFVRVTAMVSPSLSDYGTFCDGNAVLISRIDDNARWVFKAVYYMIPHFQFLNARDLWSLVSGKWLSFVLEGTGYALLYSAIVFAGSILLFRRKEF